MKTPLPVYDSYCWMVEETEVQTTGEGDSKNLIIICYAVINNNLSGKHLITWLCYKVK